VDLRSGTTGEPAGEPNTLSRQRWRLVLARAADAPDLAGRELTDAWDRAIEATGLPLHRAAGQARARVAWGAPLPSRMAAEREPAEIVLSEALPVWSVREALAAVMLPGWQLVDLYDIWLGAPALAGRVSGAVYRTTLAGDAVPDEIAAAAVGLLESRELPRTRLKGGATVTYDLRPLLAGIAIVHDGPPVVLRVETRIHPERGSGRPEEVVAALGDRLGRPIAARSIVRERLILADRGD
jgi:hypothetical protein